MIPDCLSRVIYVRGRTPEVFKAMLRGLDPLQFPGTSGEPRIKNGQHDQCQECRGNETAYDHGSQWSLHFRAYAGGDQ